MRTTTKTSNSRPSYIPSMLFSMRPGSFELPIIISNADVVILFITRRARGANSPSYVGPFCIRRTRYAFMGFITCFNADLTPFFGWC